MLSTRLIELVENHADELMCGLSGKLKTHPRTRSFARLADQEVFSRSFDIYRHLGEWMEGAPEEKMCKKYEELGAERFHEDIPLHEALYALVLMKNNLLDYIRTYGLAGSVVEIYAHQELIRLVNHFFDNASYHSVVGYEQAAASAAAKGEHPRGAVGASVAQLSRL